MGGKGGGERQRDSGGGGDEEGEKRGRERGERDRGGEGEREWERKKGVEEGASRRYKIVNSVITTTNNLIAITFIFSSSPSASPLTSFNIPSAPPSHVLPALFGTRTINFYTRLYYRRYPPLVNTQTMLIVCWGRLACTVQVAMPPRADVEGKSSIPLAILNGQCELFLSTPSQTLSRNKVAHFCRSRCVLDRRH